MLFTEIQFENFVGLSEQELILKKLESSVQSEESKWRQKLTNAETELAKVGVGSQLKSAFVLTLHYTLNNNHVTKQITMISLQSVYHLC